MSPFEFSTASRILFGPGKLNELEAIVRELGQRVLLVVGARSAEQSGLLARLQQLLPVRALARCAREPQIDDVDSAVAAARDVGCDVVVAVGGGSVLDCGKAAAGMLTNEGSLADYLEGIGTGRVIEQRPLPMIAVPTTAGTGSEVTKNAVLSGPGYKKSIRHRWLIPDVALVDPELTLGAPQQVTAACGMDALTQLIEAHLSTGASPLTDGMALRGIEAIGRGLVTCCDGPDNPRAREDVALGSLLGGICLANAGLGAVHGLASPIGALSPAGHGAVCAALLEPVTRTNLRVARGTPAEQRVEARVAAVGEALAGRRCASASDAVTLALDSLAELRQRLRIPTLGALGVPRAALAQIIAGARGSSMRYNPVTLPDAALEEALSAAW